MPTTKVKESKKSGWDADIKLAFNDTAFEYGQSEHVTIAELAVKVHGLEEKLERAMNRLGIK